MTPKVERLPSAATAAKGNAPVDAGLLLKRLENRILHGEKLDQVRALLRKESLWHRLDLPGRLQWAELAQMAQDPATAGRVLEEIHITHPDCIQAWERHLEMIALLGPAKAFTALLGRARSYIGESRHSCWLKSAQEARTEEDKELAAAVSPFERHHRHVAALRHFLSLFAGRADCFARQWADRKAGKQGYVPERRAIGVPDLEAHLAGRMTYGIYLLQPDGHIRLAVIDADLHKGLREQTKQASNKLLIRREAAHLARRIKELSQAVGLVPLVEFSGAKGYHFWFFFDSPVPAGPVRMALQKLVRQVEPDLTAFGLEVFPKQDQPVGKGFGNLVKLPLGLHRATGKRSFFPDCADRSTDAQLTYLSSIRPADPRPLIQSGEIPAAVVLPHPRWRQWAENYPELYCLQNACAPLAQAMSFCLEGGRLSLREEKILYQTVGFLPRAGQLIHHLLANLPEYNPHLVDYRLSRLRGTPLGCRRIHVLLNYSGPMCRFARSCDYMHPLLHVDGWREPAGAPAEKTENLASALERLQSAMTQVERFLK